MHSFQNIISLVEISFISTFTILSLLGFFFRIFDKTITKVSVIISIFLVMLFPFKWLSIPLELPLSGYIRGIVGDLSITTIILFFSQTFRLSMFKSPSLFTYIIALIALLFYPFSMGFSMIDPYSWGYDSYSFFYSVAILSILFIFMKNLWMSFTISIAIIFWALEIHDSSNLWDYLIDPWLCFWAIGISFKSIWKYSYKFFLKENASTAYS